jgi:hypothetical protein
LKARWELCQQRIEGKVVRFVSRGLNANSEVRIEVKSALFLGQCIQDAKYARFAAWSILCRMCEQVIVSDKRKIYSKRMKI